MVESKNIYFSLVELLKKSENLDDKIDRVNSIRITKSINLLLFYMMLGFFCDVDIFKQTVCVQSIFREVNGCNGNNL